MNKEKWISYILRVLVSWIVLFGIGYYKQMHPKTPDEISAVDIQEGFYNLFTKEQKECGHITIKKIDENRYTCFLEQYSPKVGEKKYKLFKG